MNGGGTNFVHPSELIGGSLSSATDPSDYRMRGGAVSVKIGMPDPRSQTLGSVEDFNPGEMANPR